MCVWGGGWGGGQVYSSGGSRGVRSSSDEPPFFPSDQLTASNFSTPKISVLDGNRASADFISSAGA